MTESHRDEIARLEVLHEQHPEGRVFTHLAEAYRKAGELERALETVETGLARHSDYASAHVVRGRILLDLERSGDAVSAFERVLELDRHNLIALRALGELARNAGRRDEALGHFRELVSIDPSDSTIAAEVTRLEAERESEPADSEAVPAAAEAAQAPADEAIEPLAPSNDGGDAAPETAGTSEPSGAEEGSQWESFETASWPEPGSFGAAAAEASEPQEDVEAPIEAEFGRTEELRWWELPGEGEAAEGGPLAFDDVQLTEPSEPANGWPEVEAAGEAADAPEAAVEEPAAESGGDFHWSFPGWGDEEAGTVEVRTETMATLYASQGLWERAAEVYRRLLEERPGDERLEEKLREAESRIEAASQSMTPASEAQSFESRGDHWLEGVESAWTGSGGAIGSSVSPYLPDEETAEDEAGPTAGEYLRFLAEWRPGQADVVELEEPDEGEAALREWLAESPGLPATETEWPEAVELAAEEVSEEDEDVEMFRSWLQSLRK